MSRTWVGALSGAAVFLVAGLASAQSTPAAPTTIPLGDWQLAPSLEVRTRGEYRHDPPDLGGVDFFGRTSSRVRDAWLVSERTRLGLGAERGALRAQFTLQDARAWGSSTPSAVLDPATGTARLAPYEAFLEMHSSAARPAYLRIGRQAVVWGEGRLIGNADFSPVGRSLDAVRGHVAAGNFDFEALASILESPGPLGTSFADTSGPSHSGVELYGLLARWTIDPLFRIEAMGLMRMSRSDSSAYDGSRFEAARLSGERYTASLRVFGEAKGWDYGAEGAYQLGNAASLAPGGADIAAWAAAAHVQKLFDQVALTPTLRIAGSYASGDDGGSKVKAFDPMLADPQRFHGQMDLFGWSNEMDASGRVTIVPWTDTSFGVEYRYARLANGAGEWIDSYSRAIASAQPTGTPLVTAPTTTTNTVPEELGHEIDVAFAWRPWLPLELRVGWSGLFMGSGAKQLMERMQRGNREINGSYTAPSMSQYAYGQATLTVP